MFNCLVLEEILRWDHSGR